MSDETEPEPTEPELAPEAQPEEPPAEETPSPETPEEVAPVARGRWQCLNPKGCADAQEQRTFEGPVQAEAQMAASPLLCPACGSKSIIYAGELTPAKA